MVIDNSPYLLKFNEYVESVVSGERVAGLLEVQMVDRYLTDLKRSEESDFRFRFDVTRGEDVCYFISKLEHSTGEYAGQPFELHGFQVFIAMNLFGWVEKDTGHRRFREAFISVGRGNGKTPFGAAMLLYLLAFDYPIEQEARCYCAAVKRDQASLAFDAVKRFVEKAGLSGLYADTYKHSIHVRESNSTLVPLSSDAKSADGLNIHGLLRDEVHAWTEFQRYFYEKLSTAMGKRRQPMAITITTAGDENSLIWKEEYAYACKVVNVDSPVVADSLFVAIYQIDISDDELDPTSWPKSNPMLETGVVKERYLHDMADKARENPGRRQEFRRYHGNILSSSTSKSFTETMWKSDTEIPWDEITNVFSGVDLGWCDDLAAIGHVAPLDYVSIEGKSKRRYAVWCESWVPAGTKRDLNKEPFRTLLMKERLIKTDSEWTDVSELYKELEEVHEDYGISSLAYDPANAREFGLNCENELCISTFSFAQQHRKYNEPFREFKRALIEGRIIHGGDPLLIWAACNCVDDRKVSAGEELVMPSKRRSADKIDPFVAVLMAYSEALFAESESGLGEPIFLQHH